MCITIRWKPFILNLLISLGVGGVAALLTKENMNVFETLVKPSLTPPQIVFPIVWTILYVLMGISAYIVYESRCPLKRDALLLYGIQLVLNFAWSLVFFNLKNYLLAFIVLVVLWLAIIWMIYKFFKISPLAAKLQIPYLVWVTFAAYLNLAIVILN